MARWRGRMLALALACLPALAWAGDMDSARQGALREVSSGPRAFPDGAIGVVASGCTHAEPQLREALQLLRDTPPPDRGRPGTGYTLLELGRCAMALGRERDAARLLRGVERWGNAGMIAQARACLARLYEQGRSVEHDPERALALYVLAGGESCEPGGERTLRAAAEQLLALDPEAGRVHDGLVYALLRRGSARDWQRMLELQRRHFGSAGSDNDIPIAFGGLQAGRDNDEDRAAMRALSLELGRLFLARGERALAYGYLRMADPAAAAESLQRWQQEARYRLILPDGREWKAGDAQP